jgi:ABC-type glycerol-3-phosphate transport system substrate-binding protein
MKSRIIALPVLASGVLALTLTACAPGGTASASDSAEKPSTDLGSEKITLTVVSTPESGAPLAKIIPAFEQKRPNVTVELSKTTFDDYNKGLALSLASNSSPDVALLNMMGNNAKNGLVVDLDEYAKLYHWDTEIPSTLLSQWKVGSDKVGLGGDSLYALPTSGSVVGLYYNKDLLAKAGISAPPQTLDELTADLKKAKEAGLVPLQLGNAQGHAAFLIQGVGQGIDGAEPANAWALGRSGSTFNTKGNRTGAQTLLDYATEGLVPSDANAVDLQGAVTKFGSGEGVFLNDGNWDAGAIEKALGDKAGFAVFPGAKPTAIGSSTAYAISAKSKHPNAAAAFLDFLRSDAAAQASFDAGFLPFNTKAITAKPGLQADLVKTYGEVNEANGIVSFNNNATASMNDTLTQQTQELLSGKTTVDALVTAVQADWAGSHK